MSLFITLFIFAEMLLVLLLLWREGLCESFRSFVLSVLLVAVVFFIRVPMLPLETADFQIFLSGWVEFFKHNGGFEALAFDIGNYNPPYLYFLALFSYFDIYELYPIKLLSMLFDVLMAWSVLKLVSLYTEDKLKRFSSFFLALLLPTVMLNGARWGQCDSIYVFFALIAVYLALSDRPIRSMLCLAASLAFKLQAVFVMPVFFVFLIKGKIKPLHLAIFPAAYVLYLLPPVIFGRDFVSTMTVYFQTASTVGDGLNYNSPSMYSLITGLDTELWSTIGVAVAFAFMLLVFLVATVFNDRLDTRLMLCMTLLLCIGIPFLLPHMHDRYFYSADVLSLAFCFFVPASIPAAIMVQAASLLCYYAYLNGVYLVDPRLSGLLMLLALLSYIVICAVLIYRGKNNSGKISENCA